VTATYTNKAKNCATENYHGKRYAKTIRTKETSTIIGKMLNISILRTAEKDYAPLDTILITLPVSLLRWYAKDIL